MDFIDVFNYEKSISEPAANKTKKKKAKQKENKSFASKCLGSKTTEKSSKQKKENNSKKENICQLIWHLNIHLFIIQTCVIFIVLNFYYSFLKHFF